MANQTKTIAKSSKYYKFAVDLFKLDDSLVLNDTSNFYVTHTIYFHIHSYTGKNNPLQNKIIIESYTAYTSYEETLSSKTIRYFDKREITDKKKLVEFTIDCLGDVEFSGINGLKKIKLTKDTPEDDRKYMSDIILLLIEIDNVRSSLSNDLIATLRLTAIDLI